MGDFIGNQPVPTVKGPRNYIQLSDGFNDLTFNSNVFVNSNNIINGHIGGSGVPTQLAFFDGSSSIASTPGASANVQVEFSQTKGLRRLSSTFTNSWEDGHLGNSSNIFFTPSDFTNINNSGTSRTPVPDGNASTWGIAPATQGSYGGVMGTVAPAAGSSIIAIKIIPKGFKIPVITDGASVYVSNAAPSVGRVVFYYFDMELNSGRTRLTTFVGGGELINAAVTSTDTEAASPVGNGSLAVMVQIVVPSGEKFFWNSTGGQTLVGARISIVRG